jgi:hypothetical protein
MMRQLVLACALVCASTAAWAQDALPDGASYPDPGCTKPQTDLIAPETANAAAVGNYNAKVRKFNRDSAAYGACMRAYIDTANHDVQRIQDKANADLKEITMRANVSMKAIQDKLRRAADEANSVAASLNAQADSLRKR